MLTKYVCESGKVISYSYEIQQNMLALDIASFKNAFSTQSQAASTVKKNLWESQLKLEIKFSSNF